MGATVEKWQRVNRFEQGKNRLGEGGQRLRGRPKSSLPGLPLITVITAVYNGEAHLEEAIQSVLGQTYANLEYVVIDGGSTDGTLDILKKYDDRIDYWVSESDRGISDAFNKGILVSRGDYLNFQGDGDGFVESDAVEQLMKEVGVRRPLLIASRIERVAPEGTHLFFSPRLKASRTQFLFRMAYPHQGLFTHIDFFNRYGLFDPGNRYCMDYEHLLRAYPLLSDAVVSNRVTARWRADGLGNGRTREILKEYDAIKRKHQVAHPVLLSILNAWSVFKFRVKKCLFKAT